MYWEDRVHHDPDGIEVSAIFDDIHGADAHHQYEAVVGLYWLADFRPTRVNSFESDLLGLLGAMPAFGLGDSADSGGTTTRDWAAKAVAEYAIAYPQIIPEIIDRAQSSDRQTREDSRRALGYIGESLYGTTITSSDDDTTGRTVAEHIHDHRSIITDWLHDEGQSTTFTALKLLSGIAPWYCETATTALPIAASLVDNNDFRSYLTAMSLIQSVALCNDQRRAAVVDELIGTLPEPDSEHREQRLRVALRMLVDIAEQNPDCRSQIDDLPDGLTDHEDPTVRDFVDSLSSHWGRP